MVSHGQSHLIAQLLEDIDRYCHSTPLHVTVTVNVPEPHCFDPDRFSFPVHLLSNACPRGFSANHNAAFKHGESKYPCDYLSIVNPDIRFFSNPFPQLLECMEGGRAGVAAPLVLNVDGGIEDSARYFPTPLSILKKVLRKRRRPDYEDNTGKVSPDWVAGMFMLIPTDIFRRLAGFDERYFLYYEDVDLCARMRIAGYDVRLCPHASVVHEARRESHRSLKYLRWHMASMLRFFLSSVYFSIVSQRLSNHPRYRA